MGNLVKSTSRYLVAPYEDKSRTYIQSFSLD